MSTGAPRIEIADVADPADIVAQILTQNSGKACITNSLQAEDMVILHLLREHIPDVPVLFLDTGYHFQETYEFRDRIANEWKLNFVNVQPGQTVPEQEAQLGILY